MATVAFEYNQFLFSSIILNKCFIMLDNITTYTPMKPLIILFILILMSCSNSKIKTSTEPLSWQHCYQSFEKHVLEISGLKAKDCGFFTLESSKKDIKTVKECLKQTIKEKMPFRAGHKSFGIDSWYCEVAIRDTNGKSWSFIYDSDVTGGGGYRGGHAVIWVSECLDIKLNSGALGRDNFVGFKQCTKRKDIVEKLLR
jgi:hypothetical protein